MITSKPQFPEFSRLVDIIKKLRDPDDGCPWDLKQTHQTLLKYLLEESYEFVYAVENDPSEMEEELGDILLQVLLHSQIASETNKFDIESVSKVLADKMTRRHPHVFDMESSNQPSSELTDEILQKKWDQVKKQEALSKSKKYQSQPEELLPMSSFHGPSLSVSSKIGKKTRAYKFDWNEVKEVADKVEEEWLEVKQELLKHTKKNNNTERIQEEIGDLLFSVAQLSRHIGVDPEQTLRMANQKFLKRFNSMNILISKEGRAIEEVEQEELEVFWKKVKSGEKCDIN